MEKELFAELIESIKEGGRILQGTTLRNWEQRRRKPHGAARVLLRISAKNPKSVL